MQICEGPVFRAHPVGAIPPIREDPNPERSSFSNALRDGNSSPNRRVPNPIRSPIREDPNPERSSFLNPLRGATLRQTGRFPIPKGPFSLIRKGRKISNVHGGVLILTIRKGPYSPIRRFLTFRTYPEGSPSFQYGGVPFARVLVCQSVRL